MGEANMGRICKLKASSGFCPNSYSRCKVSTSTTPISTCHDVDGWEDPKMRLTCSDWGGDSNANSIIDCSEADDEYWKVRGLKSNDLKAVRKNCPLSCGTCSASPSANSADSGTQRGPESACMNKKSDSKCAKKVNKGKCYKKSGAVKSGMKKKCRKACGLC